MQQKITAFIDESVNNSFKFLQLYGVDVPSEYTKSGYAYIICCDEVVPTEEIPNNLRVQSQGICLVDNELDDFYNHRNKEVDEVMITEISSFKSIKNDQLDRIIYNCATLAFKKVLEVLLTRKNKQGKPILNEDGYPKLSNVFEKDVTIYTDNRELAITWGLDPNLESESNNNLKDREIVNLIERFSNLKLIWISREKNKLADRLVSPRTKTKPNKEIIEKVSVRIKELDNLINIEELEDIFNNLYHLEYLVKKGLDFTDSLIDKYDYGTSQRLLLSVKKKWLENIFERIKNSKSVTVEELCDCIEINSERLFKELYQLELSIKEKNNNLLNKSDADSYERLVLTIEKIRLAKLNKKIQDIKVVIIEEYKKTKIN